VRGSAPIDRAEQFGPYVDSALTYCEQIKDGTIPACQWVKKATERFWLEFHHTPPGLIFDCFKADEACAFIETLPHVKGEWAKRRELIRLEPWQCFIVVCIFGWLDEATNTRRFRTVYIEVARKNAKSTLAAAILLYMFTQDGEPGSECFTVATKHTQARIVFDIARQMALRANLPNVTVFKHNMHILDDASICQPLAAESSTLDGLNIHISVNDEVHAWKVRDLYDVIDTATGSRLQPLIFNITTSGNNLEGVCYEMNGYVRKLLDGLLDDDSVFGIIYTVDKDDDWEDETTWKKANPNYGVSVYPMDMQRAAKKAQQVPAEQTAFLNKRLDVWTAANEAWMPMRQYALQADPALKLADFNGMECYAGADLASKNDIASLGQIFPVIENGKQHWFAFCHHFLPEFAVANAANKGIYDGWVRQGLIHVTTGASLDMDYVEPVVIEALNATKLMMLGFDPGHNSTQFGIHMDRVYGESRVVEVRPLVKHFSDPMKWLEAFVQDGTWHHDGDPVLTWMVSNVEFKRDHNDGIFPRKQAYERKIDGVIALLMALNLAMAGAQKPRFEGRLFSIQPEVGQ
jgi:phage terminase large subunit-like protein